MGLYHKVESGGPNNYSVVRIRSNVPDPLDLLCVISQIQLPYAEEVLPPLLLVSSH